MLLLVCKWCWCLKLKRTADRFLLQWEAELLCCQTVWALVSLAPPVISLNCHHSVLQKLIKLPESITIPYYLLVGLSLQLLLIRMWLLIWLCIIKSEVTVWQCRVSATQYAWRQRHILSLKHSVLLSDFRPLLRWRWGLRSFGLLRREWQ